MACWGWGCIVGFIFEARGIQNGGKMAAEIDQNGIQRFKNGLQEGVRKRYEKEMQILRYGQVCRTPHVVPLKNIPEWGKGHLTCIRDIPLVPQGTVADLLRTTYYQLFISHYLLFS